MQGGSLSVELVLSGFSQWKFHRGLCIKNSLRLIKGNNRWDRLFSKKNYIYVAGPRRTAKPRLDMLVGKFNALSVAIQTLIVDNKRRSFNKTSTVLDAQIGCDTHPKAIHILHRPRIVNKFKLDSSKNEVFITGSDPGSQSKKREIIKHGFVLWRDHSYVRKHHWSQPEP
jgi:hypothetical protein